ncbi:IclR family transcriptional regulator [Amorphus coralli]|uniref:IclR family transcriptional regulator n=1 Tax=Amorphus coralli TaxID=340680 RepID=UPI000361E22C|nr:IclR family transcriptional regulator [Amorphus coralli]
MDRDKPTAYEVPPVKRAIAVLKYVGAGNSCANISRAAKDLSINRTTLIRLLHTLREERMIEERDENAGYRLGLGLIGLATESMNGRDVIQVGRPRLATLATTIGLSAHLGVLDGHEVIYLVRESPNSHLVSNVREGTRLPAHATTMGRIILAYLPEDELAALYRDAPMEGFTDRTATSFEALTEQIAADRATGIAWSAANFEPGIGSCACAVFDHRDRPVAAINVSGPEHVFRQDESRLAVIGDAVQATAREISERLGHRPA